MRQLSILVLGTDPLGDALSRRLSDRHPEVPVGQAGPSVTGTHRDNAQRLGRWLSREETSRSFPVPLDGENLDSNADESVWTGGPPFELERTASGFWIRLVDDGGDLQTVHAACLLVTAPPVLDLLHEGLALPGVDSASAGLVAEQTEASLDDASTALYRLEDEKTPSIWGTDFGLVASAEGATEADGVYAAGQAAAKAPDHVLPEKLLQQLDPPPDPPDGEPDSPERTTHEDLAMPEGFVDTKTQQLQTLVGDALDAEEGSRRPLISSLEGIAGEVESYSRFRTDPRLRRLRWKARTAVNFLRPFLVPRGEVTP